MSVNRLVSIMNPVLNAMEDLNIDHDKLIPKFVRWATQAEIEIGSKYQYITKREVLTINNCTACLPLDAVYVQIGVLGDYGCNCADLMANACGSINPQLGTLSGTNGSFLIVDVAGGNGTTISGSVPFSIQGGKLIFASDLDAQAITIQYLAISKDCDGFTEIGQNHVLAITWYIKWNYYLNKNNINSFEYGKANKAEQEWHRECAHARAVDSQISDGERYEIVWGMLHNPHIGISVSTGMHTSLDNGYGWGL